MHGSGEGLRCFAKALGRRANLRMAQQVPTSCQGLGVPKPKSPCLCVTRVHPAHGTKARQRKRMIPDRLLTLTRNLVAVSCMLCLSMALWIPRRTHGLRLLSLLARLRADWAMLALLGLLGFCLFPYFFTVTLRYTAAGQAVVILPTIPMLTLLFSAALGRERLTGRRILSLLIAAAGACVALDGTGLNGLSIGYASFGGNTLMFAAAISSAMYNVLVPPLAVWHGP